MSSSAGSHPFELVDPFAELALARNVHEFRRLHERAHLYWVSLLHGRALPAVADIDFDGTEGLEPHAALVALPPAARYPSILHIGPTLAAEWGIEPPGNINLRVPASSLLRRLLDHFQDNLLAQSGPIGFEAEYPSGDGAPALYRGVLLPLSNDGRRVDHLLAVLNWRRFASAGPSAPDNGRIWHIAD